jgi:phage terminase small subunit
MRKVVKMPQNAALTRKQELFLLNYVSLPTMTSACRAAGISDDTGWRWLKLPQVKAAYQEMKQAHFDETLAALIVLARSAITTLGRNMKEDAPPGVQVRAAQLILENAIELHKISTLEAQIEELKQLILERHA